MARAGTYDFHEALLIPPGWHWHAHLLQLSATLSNCQQLSAFDNPVQSFSNGLLLDSRFLSPQISCLEAGKLEGWQHT
jgi:hypothetical protein